MPPPSILPRRYRQELGQRRAPNQISRGAWWKMFTLCGAVIAVLFVAEQARKPNAWRFFDKLDEAAAQREEAPPDPRYSPKPSRTAHDPLGTFISSADKLEPVHDDNESAPTDLEERAWRQGWKQILPGIATANRQTSNLSVIYEALWRARQRELLPGELTHDLAIVVDALDGLWTSYQTDALQSLLNLPEADQANWSEIVRRTDARWKQDLKPALASLSDGRSPTEAEMASLTAWQEVLDEIQLKAVQDDTVWRSAEREIWFRLLERVREGKGMKEAAHATYGQLFKQPKDYRGKAVTIRGTARQAYRVKAPSNWLGIDYYYVFVVQPEDGANSPIIVYSLEVPPGLPPIKDKDVDRATTELREDMEFTGVFFRRWAYLGKNGTYVAPLILAKTGVVHHSPLFKPQEELPSATSLAWILGGVVAASLVLTGLAFWITGRGKSSLELPSSAEIAKSLDALEHEHEEAT